MNSPHQVSFCVRCTNLDKFNPDSIATWIPISKICSAEYLSVIYLRIRSQHVFCCHKVYPRLSFNLQMRNSDKKACSQRIDRSQALATDFSGKNVCYSFLECVDS